LNLGDFFCIFKYIQFWNLGSGKNLFSDENIAMILIYPAIEISGKRSVEIVHGVPGSEHLYSVDPVQLAVMWRGENAKTLHIVDLDGAAEGRIINEDVIRDIIKAVDIPVQMGGGLRTYEEIKKVLGLGVYRVTIGTAAVEQPGLIEHLVKEFGTRKIAISIIAEGGKVTIRGGAQPTEISAIDLALDMAEIGVSRILYEEREGGVIVKTLPYERLKELAIYGGIRVTARGGVSNYKDLMRLQELEKYGVDSVIVGRPLYENHFACQALWRLNELALTDLGPTRRI
jgi:phosphoribosylformimino-5-aminoimidazole carboxamide ribotide isomerase